MVFSKSGRDAGKMYIIFKALNERLVLLVDGDIRQNDNPKVKNLKHLSITNTVAHQIRDSLLRGEIPENQVIKSSLKMIKETGSRDGKEVW